MLNVRSNKEINIPDKLAYPSKINDCFFFLLFCRMLVTNVITKLNITIVTQKIQMYHLAFHSLLFPKLIKFCLTFYRALLFFQIVCFFVNVMQHDFINRGIYHDFSKKKISSLFCGEVPYTTTNHLGLRYIFSVRSTLYFSTVY